MAADPSGLETPEAADLLYEARGEEVRAHRPVMTGDVFAGVPLPEQPEGTGFVAVVTHPCSMRRDGVDLAARLHVAPAVGTGKPRTDWARSPVAYLPLPEMRPVAEGEHLALDFEQVERVATSVLEVSARIACLSAYGVELLQQRYAHYLTRIVVPTSELHVFVGPLFDEAELLEQWLEDAEEAGVTAGDAAQEFHAFLRLRRPDAGSPQDLLKDPQQAAHVRRLVRAEARRRFGS